MSSARLHVVAAEQVVEPLLVHHGQVVPLREVEPQHADAALAHPFDRGIVAQVVERQHQDRMPRIHSLRRLGAAAGETDRGAEDREGHRGRGEDERPACAPPRGQRPLARDGLRAAPRRSASARPGASPAPSSPRRPAASGTRAGAARSAPAARRCAWRRPRDCCPGTAGDLPASRRRRRRARRGRSGCPPPRPPPAPGSCRPAFRPRRPGRCWSAPSATIARAMPKSARSGRPVPRSSRTFSGFTSRCTTPARPAASSAEARSATIRVTSAIGSLPSRSSRLSQALALHLVHDVVEEALRRAGRVHGDDAGVAEPRDGARFGEEAADDGRVSGELGVDDLDGHRAIERGVGRAEDDAHTAAPELALQPVLRRERCLESRERFDRRVAHAKTGREGTVSNIPSRASPLDALSLKKVAPGVVSRCFGLNPV